MVKLKT